MVHKMTKDWESTYRQKGEVQSGSLFTVKEAAKIFAEKGARKVLDIACGTGRHSIFLANLGFDVVGVDEAKSGLNVAAQKAQDHGLQNVTFIQKDMKEISDSLADFDAAICVWSTGHGYQQDLIDAVREMIRILKPGGVLCADFPSRSDSYYGHGTKVAEHTFLHDWLDHADVPHYYTSVGEIRALLASHCSELVLKEIEYWCPKYKRKIPSIWVVAQKMLEPRV